MKLYEIAESYRAIDSQLDESGGEVTPEIEAALSALSDRLSEKVDAIGALVREAQAESQAFADEAARLRGRAAAAASKVTRLKAYLLNQLKAIGFDRVKGLRFVARVATASTPTITWEGDGDPPGPFRRVRVELDGKLAHEAEKAGTLPEGFKVVRTEYIDIR